MSEDEKGLHTVAIGKQRVIIVAVQTDMTTDRKFAASLAEIQELAKTAGADEIEILTQKRQRPDPRLYIGHGKVDELVALCEESEEDTIVVCNANLSPSQQRNLEERIEIPVFDRTWLILDIFAGRAKSSEGKIQVELAQLKYMLPRLTGMREGLSRQGGGIGTRGPGETKLEVDRRKVREKISSLEKDIKDIVKVRQVQRSERGINSVPLFAIVGYTNAGKSTLFNKLTSSDVLAEDKLFATLDTTSRKLRLPGGQYIIVSDTVGFIRELPHDLVAAFQATLQETIDADFLLHVMDINDPEVLEKKHVVERVLSDLQAENKSTLLILNKIDMEYDESLARAVELEENFSSLRMSAIQDDLSALLEQMEAAVISLTHTISYVLPYNEGWVLDHIRKNGTVIEETYAADGIHVKALINESSAGILKRFEQTSEEEINGLQV